MCRIYGSGHNTYIRLCYRKGSLRGYRLLIGMTNEPAGCVPMTIIRSGKYKLLPPVKKRSHAPSGFGGG